MLSASTPRRPYVWIIGRTQTNGVKDYETVHKVQDGYKITRLADWGKRRGRSNKRSTRLWTPRPSRCARSTRCQRSNISSTARSYEAERASRDRLVDHWRMKRIGLEPGTSFDGSKVSGDALSKGAAAGLKLMQDKIPTIARVTNGWRMNTDTMGLRCDCTRISNRRVHGRLSPCRS